ncbi:MAG: hypothetical protein GY795_42715 [Desulfobacterales bacterium]|nr:hypothetical protein [Desulfobacterales bacterium]
MKFWQIPWFSAKISFQHSHASPHKLFTSNPAGEQIPAGLSRIFICAYQHDGWHSFELSAGK